jgi:ankyrin repeat protein
LKIDLLKQISKKKIEELFFHAIMQNHIKQVRYFLEKKIVDVNTVDLRDQRTALQIAASQGNKKY